MMHLFETKKFIEDKGKLVIYKFRNKKKAKKLKEKSINHIPKNKEKYIKLFVKDLLMYQY